MAGPALRSYIYNQSVCGEPYTRVLHPVDEIGDCKDDEEEYPIKRDEDEANSSESLSEDNESDEESAKPGDERNTTLVQIRQAEPYRDFAQIQKKQAWLRGGQGEADVDASETASIRSTKKRAAKPPGLLERLLLPQTSAAVQRSSVARKNASTRPAARRRHTVDLSSAPVPLETPATPDRAKVAGKGREQSRSSKPTGTSSVSPKASPSASAKVECVTCLDEVPKHRAAVLKCKHRMCHTCLKRIFTLSTTDPQLMPPKCCTDDMIPLEHVQHLFNNAFKVLWNRKYSEYTTKHRLYCPTKGCGKWIKPKRIERDMFTGRKRGTCKECKTQVCQKCGLKWHGTKECENDESTKRVIDLGKEQGWQRCYSCRAMVQLSEGCNHMRCRCNAEFCMVCGQKWKTCDCPWFNLPPELGVDGFLDPGQAIPLPPLGERIGELPPPFDLIGPPIRVRVQPPPAPRPPPFLDRRDMPLDPLNLGDMFRPSGLDRPHRHRRRTVPATPALPRDQEAADEALARRLQEQEINSAAHISNLDDPELHLHRRASRRQRRREQADRVGDGPGQEGENLQSRPLPSVP